MGEPPSPVPPLDYSARRCYCGRLDEHKVPHNWSAPQGVAIAPRTITYICFGPPIVEGAQRSLRS